MANYFTSYINTVRRMIKSYNHELYNVFCEPNIEENWVDHDNWNGGIDFYTIVLRIPVELFEDFRKRGIIEDVEKTIYGFYMDAMRGDGESVQLRDFVIKPVAEDIQVFGDNVDDSMWKPGYFRLFISHLSEFKGSASNLKHCLSHFGIDCFVAHEDITPSKEWAIEIEKSLFTMDALCAIVAPNFIKSRWCDQEVGIALGQKKLVISINKGANPYGFFGKYQALKSKNKSAKEVADDVMNAILVHDSTKSIYLNKLVALIFNATNIDDAKRFIQVLANLQQVDKWYIEQLHSNYSTNAVLNDTDLLSTVNPIFQKYGLAQLSMTTANNSYRIDDDLPF